MNEDPHFPPGIGPHEGRELELMLAGEKPLAMFYDAVPATIDLPEADFAPHVTAGRIVMREEIYKAARTGNATRYVYYALPKEVWRIDALHAMQSGFYAGHPATDEDDIEIGRLLGYSEADIQCFIRWRRDIKPKPFD
jgi:hypothetical protein